MAMDRLRRWLLVTRCQCRECSFRVKAQACTLSSSKLEGTKLGGVLIDP